MELAVENLDELLQRKRRCDEKLEQIQSRNIKEKPKAAKKHTEPTYDQYIIENTTYIDLDLPGVFKEDIHFQVTTSGIIVSGEFPTPVDVHEDDFVVQRRIKGKFEYNFAFPKDKFVQEYDSNLEDGVLHLKLRLSDSAQQKQIPDSFDANKEPAA